MNRRKLIKIATSALLLSSIGGPAIDTRRAAARGQAPGAHFHICLDCSGSMYNDKTQHFLLQRDGHYAAILDSEIVAFLIALRAYVQVWIWGELPEQVLCIFEGLMETEDDVKALAEAVKAKVPTRKPKPAGTNHYTVLEKILEVRPRARRRIIDLSTDEGPLSAEQIDACVAIQERFQNEEPSIVTHINVLGIRLSDSQRATLERIVVRKGFLEPIRYNFEILINTRRKFKFELSNALGDMRAET